MILRVALFLALIAGPRLSGEVISITQKDSTVTMPQRIDRPWKLGDRVCVADEKNVEHCGHVTLATEESAIVTLEKPKARKKKHRAKAKAKVKKPEAPPVVVVKRAPEIKKAPPPPARPAAPRVPAATTTAIAPPPVSNAVSPLNHFGLAAFGGFSSGQNSFSALVSWDPSWNLGKGFGVRGNVGLTALKAQPSGLFAVIEYGASGFVQAGPLTIDVGGGAQTWVNAGGTHPVAGATLGYGLPAGLLAVVERFFAGYSAYFGPVLTHEVRLGVGISF